MDKKECFMKNVLREVQAEFGNRHQIEICKITKNNGVILNGLVIKVDGQFSPAIYLEPYYEQFRRGMTMNEIIQDIGQLLKADTFQIERSDDLASREWVDDKIVCKLINREMNRDMLTDMPYIPVLDLAVVFYLLLDVSASGQMTMMIQKQHMEQWGMTAEDLFQVAMKNTPRLFTAECRRMDEIFKEMVQEMMGDSYDEKLADELLHETNSPLSVISNVSGLNGAIVMLYPEVLREYADRLGNDLLIIPSSTHEVLVTPYEEKANGEEMEQMVKSINSHEVPKEDILSDRVYIYWQKERKICYFCPRTMEEEKQCFDDLTDVSMCRRICHLLEM